MLQHDRSGYLAVRSVLQKIKQLLLHILSILTAKHVRLCSRPRRKHKNNSNSRRSLEANGIMIFVLGQKTVIAANCIDV